MTARVILNPYSGRWSAKARWAEAESALRQAGIEFDLVVTDGPGDGEKLAADALAAGCKPIIVAGGDGAIGEVINGLHRSSPDEVIGPLGVLPLGTANDLVHNLGLPVDFQEAARIISVGHTRRIDLGLAGKWVFDNNSALGLEPLVTINNIKMRRLKGVIRYLVAALQAISSGPHWEATIEWDDGRYQGPVSLVTVGNCAITGGLFHMAPGADPADGLLTFVYGYAETRLRMLALLPRAMSGDYVHDRRIHQHHTRWLAIHMTPDSPLQVDGEIRADALSSIEYTVLPARLDILAP
jgi:diacylglycerol kinase (ATP)